LIPGSVLRAVRDLVGREGVQALAVDDLRHDDLQMLGWSGSLLHVQSVAAALKRVSVGEVDYLVVRAPGGEPIAKGGVDQADPRGPGKLWQLATHPELQGLGLGSALVQALEERVRVRGLSSAWLGVELDNLHARRLYERLGYSPFGEEDDRWETEDARGHSHSYEARVILMRRAL
jgi:ribosomal protein S18 acetylase RimI-like enzyme